MHTRSTPLAWMRCSTGPSAGAGGADAAPQARGAGADRPAAMAAATAQATGPVLRIVISSPRTRIPPEFASPDREGSPDPQPKSHPISVLSLINGDIAHLNN